MFCRTLEGFSSEVSSRHSSNPQPRPSDRFLRQLQKRSQYHPNPLRHETAPRNHAERTPTATFRFCATTTATAVFEEPTAVSFRIGSKSAAKHKGLQSKSAFAGEEGRFQKGVRTETAEIHA